MRKIYKKAVLVSAISFLALPVFAATEATQLSTPAQKLSYTIGYEMGANFQKQNITIDPKLLSQGLSDGLANSQPLLDKEARQQAILAFQKEIIAKQEVQFKQMAEKNKKEGEQFLADNAKKPGVKTLDDGVQYKVVKQGTGAMPTLNDTVTVNYSGSFIDGQVFDSSYKRGQPATFPLGEVIKGWQQALTHMPVGSTWEVYVPAKLAYGEHGMGNAIGPNQTLIFKIELIKVEQVKKA